MTISADTSGLVGLADRFRRQGATLEPRVAAVIAKGASDIQRIAQQIVRSDSVETGDLGRSIGVTFTDKGLTATVGPTDEAGPYLEYGTNDTAAEPFMAPAAEAVLPGVNAELRRVMRRAAG